MDKKTNFFWIAVAALVFLSLFFTFYRYIIKKDYIVQAQVDCDPYMENCFVWNCDPTSDVEGESCTGDPEEDTWYFKIINKNAGNISVCDEGDEECNPLFCGENEPDCEFVFCNDGNKEENGVVLCNDPMIYRVAHPEEECGEEGVCEEEISEEEDEIVIQTTEDEISSEEEGLAEEEDLNEGSLPIAE